MCPMEMLVYHRVAWMMSQYVAAQEGLAGGRKPHVHLAQDELLRQRTSVVSAWAAHETEK